MLVLVGLLTTAMASRGSWVQRRQEKRTDSCSDVRIFNRKLQVCLKAARTQNRILEENSVESKETIKELEIKNNVSMETIKELEIKNQNLVVEAKQYDAEKHHCMVNNDILEGEIKRLKEQIECKFLSKGYKTFIMLNLAETEIYPANKCENDNNS